jgi:hypothetical protein
VTTPRLDWGWRHCADPSEAQAALAWNEAAPRLLRRLRQVAPETQARMAITATRDVLVVCGLATELPWVEGVAYAAPCAGAAGLWLPTLHEPEVPVELLARALHDRHRRAPLLLWPRPQAVIPLDRQRPATAAQLDLIEQRWSGAVL